MGCSGSGGAPDAAQDCSCIASGLTIIIQHESYCPIDMLYFAVTLAGEVLLGPNDAICSAGHPAQGMTIVLPWPPGIQAGDELMIEVYGTGDGATVANGSATVLADPTTCRALTVVTSCRSGVDAGTIYDARVDGSP